MPIELTPALSTSPLRTAIGAATRRTAAGFGV